MKNIFMHFCLTNVKTQVFIKIKGDDHPGYKTLKFTKKSSSRPPGQITVCKRAAFASLQNKNQHYSTIHFAIFSPIEGDLL